MYDETKCPVEGCGKRMAIIGYDGKSASSQGRAVYSCEAHGIPSF